MKKKIFINGDECVKYGTDNRGNQRYKRKSDGKIVNQYVKTRCEKEIRMISIFLYLNGLTLTKIGNIFNVSYNTIANWIDKLASEILNHKITDIQSINDIEIDEIYHFLDNKKKEYTFLRLLIERHIK